MDAGNEAQLVACHWRFYRSRIFLILACVALASCIPNEQIRDRFEYWTAESETFFSEARNLQQVHSWLRSHNVIYTFEDSDITNGAWSMTLEKVYFDGWWCDWVDIEIDVKLNDLQQVQDHGIRLKRACWWWS